MYEKYVNGDPLTDQEISSGIDFFGDLTWKLDQLGPVFKLSANESRDVLYSLEAYRDARANHK